MGAFTPPWFRKAGEKAKTLPHPSGQIAAAIRHRYGLSLGRRFAGHNGQNSRYGDLVKASTGPKGRYLRLTPAASRKLRLNGSNFTRATSLQRRREFQSLPLLATALEPRRRVVSPAE